MPKRIRPELATPFKRGDRVKIKHSGWESGQIVEERGALGPGGALIFRVMVPVKPAKIYIEVREDQLIALHPEPPAEPSKAAEVVKNVAETKQAVKP